ncbi:MAG: beta-N-acetylglucosaminidase [Bacteroides sp.]|nr:beta-N-acetylglucosaminidase [Bacteroides sp.]
MKLFTGLSLALAAALACGSHASAQDSFDLNSQRGEKQQFNVVPGQKIDHKGLVINPTPHSLNLTGGPVADISRGISVRDKQKVFKSGELDFLTLSSKGLPLEIDFGQKLAAKAGVSATPGAYALTVTPKKITITGFDEQGAFYGLQTLRQIVESEMAANLGGLPALTVNDFPALPYRGVVEGFYGTPWSHQVRKDLINYMGRNKMNNYIFGPKDDPYHSSPNWRLPYPPEQAAEIADLVKTANENRLDFYWAIHPGKDIRWNKEDYDSLVAKFNMMYDLGVRSFALFFDDIEGIGTDSHMQTKLLNDLTRDFVDVKGDVSNLFICPTDYSQLWANPGENGQLAIYGRELNPKAEVFWTGAVVCSDLTPETLEFVDSRINRPALYWWNYPVTDYCRNYILQGPVYGLDNSLTADQVAGIESNPMEHGEASMLALYGVADWAWNPADYNAIDNWERGLVDRLPDAAEAYRAFAINSADTETGYRRDESWETTVFPYNNYTPEQFEALRQALSEAAAAEGTILASSSNPALVGEIKPWLAQLTKVAGRGLSTLDLIKIFESGDPAAFWKNYVANLMTPADREAYNAHRVGTMKLQPFYEKAMDGMVLDFYTRLTGQLPAVPRAVGTYPNLSTTLSKLMLDNDTTTFYTSSVGQKAGDWIGLDMGEIIPVDSVNIRQGRNSVNDVDYFDNVALEVSADGKTWSALTPDMQTTYDIVWSGEPVQARYIRIARRDSKKSNWASVRTFKVNPITAGRVGLNIDAPSVDAALLAFDRNPMSTYTINGDFAFDRKAGATNLILLLGSGDNHITVIQFDADGAVLANTELTTPFADIPLDPATSRITVTGIGTIHEIIQK